MSIISLCASVIDASHSFWVMQMVLPPSRLPRGGGCLRQMTRLGSEASAVADTWPVATGAAGVWGVPVEVDEGAVAVTAGVLDEPVVAGVSAAKA